MYKRQDPGAAVSGCGAGVLALYGEDLETGGYPVVPFGEEPAASGRPCGAVFPVFWGDSDPHRVRGLDDLCNSHKNRVKIFLIIKIQDIDMAGDE